MKLVYHEQTKRFYLKSENADDQFKLGVLSVRLNAQVFQIENGQRELQFLLDDFMNALLK